MVSHASQLPSSKTTTIHHSTWFQARKMAEFQVFTRLPAELRQQIWHFALEQARRHIWHRGTYFNSNILAEPHSDPVWCWCLPLPARSREQEIPAPNPLRDLLLSCREANEYAAHLQRKQASDFTGTGVPGSPQQSRISSLLSIASFEFDSFQPPIINRAASCNILPVVHHIRHIQIYETDALVHVINLTVDRATRGAFSTNTDFDFRRRYLGPFGEPESRLQTCTIVPNETIPSSVKLRELTSFVLERS